nr:AraC family transcriptional regulator [Rhizobium sp. L1K21]
MAADMEDNVMFHIPLSGGYSMQQAGGVQWELQVGSVYLDPNEIPGVVKFSGDQTDAFYVSIPRAFLTPATSGLNAFMQQSCALTPQWRLFRDYARSLHNEAGHLHSEDLQLYATHLQDLALAALGANRDAHELAAGRGVRAARLKTIKADIEQRLTQADLNVESVARREGVSPRYIRGLFKSEGTSFSDYVAQQRLLLAHKMLCDPACRHLNISQIALRSGFGDLSWFNARFRRAFSMSPSDVRATVFPR